MKSLTSNAHYVRRHMVVIAFAALALASCGGSTGGTAAPTGASATKETGAATTGRTLDYCAHEDATTKIVHFRSAGARLEGVVIGDGSIGVVLAHQLHSTRPGHSATRNAKGGTSILYRFRLTAMPLRF
jgi:hypothetical protein